MVPGKEKQLQGALPQRTHSRAKGSQSAKKIATGIVRRKETATEDSAEKPLYCKLHGKFREIATGGSGVPGGAVKQKKKRDEGRRRKKRYLNNKKKYERDSGEKCRTFRTKVGTVGRKADPQKESSWPATGKVDDLKRKKVTGLFGGKRLSRLLQKRGRTITCWWGKGCQKPFQAKKKRGVRARGKPYAVAEINLMSGTQGKRVGT